MTFTDEQWKIHWWIVEKYPNYKAETPEDYSLIINIIDNYNRSH